jgi:hypothetical protein
VKIYKLEFGKYQSKTFNKIELTFKRVFNKEVPSAGQELYLYNDSTFILNTCGNLISGTFNIKPDTLVLLCLKNIPMRDTTKIVLYSPPNELTYYIIDSKTLYRFDIGKINNNEVLLTDNLTKTND